MALMNPQRSQQGTLAAAAARKELLRRATLVQRAMELLARLRSKQASLQSAGIRAGNQPGRAAAAVTSRQAGLKLALAYLLDDKALEALLGDLEAALASCEHELGPESYAQSVDLHTEIAQFVPSYWEQISRKNGLAKNEGEISAPAFGGK